MDLFELILASFPLRSARVHVVGPTLKVYVEGIGLSNVRERLRVLYGADFQLDIHSRLSEGTVIRIDIPELVPALQEVRK